MSLKDLQEDFTKILKPQLEEILRLLKNKQTEDLSDDRLEAVAAKIIKELKTTTLECSCSKRILRISEPSKQIISDDETTKTLTGPWKYSYPNFEVGNEQLGYGPNSKSLTWPVKKDQNLE